MIVCAHRYTVRDHLDTKRAMLGLCYILESDLSLPPNKNIGANNLLVVREALDRGYTKQGEMFSVVMVV